MMKFTEYSTAPKEESNQMSDVQFLFGKYEEATQTILRLSKELEDVKTRGMGYRVKEVELTNKIKYLECEMRDMRFGINMILAQCVDKNHEFKPTSEVTKQNLLDALSAISNLIDE